MAEPWVEKVNDDLWFVVLLGSLRQFATVENFEKF